MDTRSSCLLATHPAERPPRQIHFREMNCTFRPFANRTLSRNSSKCLVGKFLRSLASLTEPAPFLSKIMAFTPHTGLFEQQTGRIPPSCCRQKACSTLNNATKLASRRLAAAQLPATSTSFTIKAGEFKDNPLEHIGSISHSLARNLEDNLVTVGVACC